MSKAPRKIFLTKGRIALVDFEDFDYLIRWRWHFDGKYARRNGLLGEGISHLRMHRALLPAPSNKHVDHINGNKLDNRRKNLRACLPEDNQKNKGRYRCNKSGTKGVCKKPGGWRAQISIDGRTKYLGLFSTKAEAAQAYNSASRQHHGNFGRIIAIAKEDGVEV